MFHNASPTFFGKVSSANTYTETSRTMAKAPPLAWGSPECSDPSCQWRHLVMFFLSFASCSQLTFVLGTDTDDFCGSGMLSIRSKIAVIFWSESLTCTKGSPPDTLNLKRKKKPKPTNNWLNSYAKTHQFFI